MLADANSPGDSAPVRHRMTSAERRAAIVRTAVELFSQRGFRGTTTRELASAVGVSEPVLYQHFTTKRELYNAIVDHMVAESASLADYTMRQCERSADERTVLEGFGIQILNWYIDDSKNIRLLLFSALEGHDLADIWYERCTVHFVQVIESYVARRMQEGAFRPGNPVIASRAFIGMMATFGQICVLHKNPAPELSRQEVVRQFVDIFLRGMRINDAGAGEV